MKWWRMAGRIDATAGRGGALVALLLLGGACGSVVSAAGPMVYPPLQCVFERIDGRVEVSLKGVKHEAKEGELYEYGSVVSTGPRARAVFLVSGAMRVVVFKNTSLRMERKDGKAVEIVLDRGTLLGRMAGTDLRVSFVSPGGEAVVRDAMWLVQRKRGRLYVSCRDGEVALSGGGRRKKVPAGFIGILNDEGRIAVKRLSSSKRKKLSRLFQRYLEAKEIPVLPDKVPPRIRLLAPQDGRRVSDARVAVKGVVDDPTVRRVEVHVDGEFRLTADVVDGRFSTSVKLVSPRSLVSVSAADAAGNEGTASVTVFCDNPERSTQVEKQAGRDSSSAWSLETLKDPSNPVVMLIVLLAGVFMLVAAVLVVRYALHLVKKSLQKASEIATGVVFQECEKCGNREYRYSLFYTTEPPHSPLLRNLVNTVNPMTTNLMNESLESLLYEGLKRSQQAKKAEKKIHVVCTWCDVCKTGVLSFEYMQGASVQKVDEFQIIHPIFIEWVRKVYE